MTEGAVIRVMLVDDVADTRDQLEKLLFFEKDIEVVAKASNGREAVDLAKEHRPDVILMDINMPEMDGITATEIIIGSDPSVQVIIMSVQGETDYLRKAMMAGAREFLVKPVGADDLYKSIRHVYKLAASRPRMASGPMGGMDAAPGAATAKGQIFAVFSPKGGVGTSTIAANLAIALRQLSQKKVVLVDANLSLGDLNVILNLVSSRTMVDLSDRVDDLDRELLNDVLTTHASQVKVLLAPTNPQEGELITSDHLRLILEALRAEFDYVVVDTQASFHDRALAVLDMADRILVLMTLEMTCIKNIKLFMEVADLLEYSRDKIMLVLNKASNRMGIRVDNVENNIQHKVALQIANAPTEMSISINQGVPLVIGRRDHAVSKDIFRLAQELSRFSSVAEASASANGVKPTAASGDKADSQSGGFLGRFFRKSKA
jgi:pilus assembly protein CpaE